jgi:hypothetical protein
MNEVFLGETELQDHDSLKLHTQHEGEVNLDFLDQEGLHVSQFVSVLSCMTSKFGVYLEVVLENMKKDRRYS